MGTGVLKIRLANGTFVELAKAAGGGGGTDELAKISANDTTAGYLNGKLVAGANITLTEGSDGGDETLTVAATSGSGEPALGNPAANDYVLASQTDGARSWVAQSGGGFDTNAYYTLSANQAVTAAQYNKVLFDTVVFDGNTEWVVASKYWLCKTTGYYSISLSISTVYTYTETFITCLYVDGVLTHYGTSRAGIYGYSNISNIEIPNLYVVAGSYLEAYFYVSGNTSVDSKSSLTWFRITRYK